MLGMLLCTFSQRLATQLATFEQLFPSSEYALRNAASRTDGYWPFIGRKEEPPLGLTYGEFPLPLFTSSIDRGCELAGLGKDR